MQFFAIVNPVAGGRRHLFNTVARTLTLAGHEVITRDTGARGDAARLAAEAASEGCQRLIVAGGDGTMNEVLGGLAGHPSAPPIGLVPTGTANILAHEIGLPRAPETLAQVIAEGAPRPVAAGTVNGAYFLLMAGAGFDATVVAMTTRALKRWLGKGAYAFNSARAMLRFPFGAYRVEVDGTVHTARSVIVTNVRHYGGPHLIAPEADITKPEFSVLLFQQGGPLSVARYGAALLLGRLHQLDDVPRVTGRAVRIEAMGDDGFAGDEPVQGDGDIIAQLPADIAVIPDAISLIWPGIWPGTWPGTWPGI